MMLTFRSAAESDWTVYWIAGERLREMGKER